MHFEVKKQCHSLGLFLSITIGKQCIVLVICLAETLPFQLPYRRNLFIPESYSLHVQFLLIAEQQGEIVLTVEQQVKIMQ